MLFNSIPFLIFLPLVLIIIASIKIKKYQYIFLILASYFFYFYSSKAYLILFIVSSFANFFLGMLIFESKKFKKSWLIIGLLFNLGLLGFFKYMDFAIIITNDISNLFGNALNFSLLHIILPIGISFYTFEAMSYIIDIYFEKIKPEKSIVNFLLFLAFFPKLIAGPIMRASEFLPQLKKKGIVFTYDNLKSGFVIMLIGFCKKIIIADNIAPVVNGIFSNSVSFYSSPSIIFGAFLFGIQVYCDFSGYVDIAIGIAKMMGFELMPNFNRPYLSKSPAEFWRKWHMTLSFWIRDYIYTPLYVFLSNRKSIKKIKSLEIRTKFVIYAANIIALFFMGIWHGAYWNFVIFGIYNGFLLVAFHLLMDLKNFIKLKLNMTITYKNMLTYFISVALTFYFMMFGFLMFRITNLPNLFYSLKKYFIFNINGLGTDLVFLQRLLSANNGAVLAILIFVFFYSIYLFRQSFNLREGIAKLPILYYTVLCMLMILMIIIFIPSKSGVFIYFQF